MKLKKPRKETKPQTKKKYERNMKKKKNLSN